MWGSEARPIALATMQAHQSNAPQGHARQRRHRPHLMGSGSTQAKTAVQGTSWCIASTIQKRRAAGRSTLPGLQVGAGDMGCTCMEICGKEGHVQQTG